MDIFGASINIAANLIAVVPYDFGDVAPEVVARGHLGVVELAEVAGVHRGIVLHRHLEQAVGEVEPVHGFQIVAVLLSAGLEAVEAYATQVACAVISLHEAVGEHVSDIVIGRVQALLLEGKVPSRVNEGREGEPFWVDGGERVRISGNHLDVMNGPGVIQHDMGDTVGIGCNFSVFRSDDGLTLPHVQGDGRPPVLREVQAAGAAEPADGVEFPGGRVPPGAEGAVADGQAGSSAADGRHSGGVPPGRRHGFGPGRFGE